MLRERMNDLARWNDRALNFTGEKKYGFVLLVAEFGKIDHGRVNYISNGQRADMIAMVREWLARAEGRFVEGARDADPS
jgi:hypothetical protein